MKQCITAKKKRKGRNEDSNMEYKKLQYSYRRKRENSTQSRRSGKLFCYRRYHLKKKAPNGGTKKIR